MKFSYEAYDAGGRTVTGTVQAESQAAATDKLLKDGLYVSSLEAKGGGRAGPARAAHTGGHVRLRDLSAFTRQVAVLTGAGTPLVQAVSAAERQIPEKLPWRRVVEDVRKHVEEGEGLSDAMTRYPKHFGPIFRSLVAAGESGGQMNKMLDRLSKMLRQQVKVRNSVRSAMMYPVLLLFIAFTVVIVMLVAILPRFAELFETLDSPLPPTTAMLMQLSGALTNYWWVFIAVAAAAVGSLVGFFKFGPGVEVVGRWAVSAPLFGKLIKALAMARVARVLGVLLESRVPLLEALQLTREAAGNAAYAKLLADAEDAVVLGESMSSVLANSGLISPAVYEAVLTGEGTGKMGPILVSLADFMDEDNEVVVKALTGLLEPVILMVLGAAVGFVALSMFVPLFDLTAAAGAQ